MLKTFPLDLVIAAIAVGCDAAPVDAEPPDQPVRLSAEPTTCLDTKLTPEANGSVKCMIVEVLKEGTDEGKTCEELGRGLCTPGSAPCRRAGTPFPPIALAQAAEQLTLPITVTFAGGSARPTATAATVDKSNVYVVGRDEPIAKKHLVCEVQQVPDAWLQACISDPNFAVEPSMGGGFCYASSDYVQKVAPHCSKLGAPGAIRFVGNAVPRPGSEVFAYCVTN